jgi:hypothetical protein
MRLNMNVKVMLSAVGVAALLASPAVAKTAHRQGTPAQVVVPAERTNAPPVSPYGADVPQPAHKPISGLNPDFQISQDR